MRVLILEDDRWMADLLRQIILSLRPGATVEHFVDVRTALASYKRDGFDLVISDWNLPGESGLALLEEIRRKDRLTPLVMVTGRTDRQSVLAVKSLGASAYIAKPFNVPSVVESLRRFIPAEGEAISVPAPASAFLDHLAGLPDGALDLPLMGGVRQSLDQMQSGEPPSLRELARRWKGDPALTARLVSVANSSHYNPSGRLCTDLQDALARLGWQTAINIATGLSLRRSCELSVPAVAALAARELELIEQLSERVTQLSLRCGIDPAPCQTGALLHRLGELCVLFHAQDWFDRTGALDEAELRLALERFGRPFADRLKAHWRFPVPLRDLIGTIYGLSPGTTRREHYLMRLAGGEVHGGLAAAERERLQRLAGLEPF